MRYMINFEMLEKNAERYKKSFFSALPFEHVVIDNFCDPNSLSDALDKIPDAAEIKINKSNDFIFAKNKYEKSNFNELCEEFATLKEELLSSKFSKWVSYITNENIFIDPSFHGGGLHQGGIGSFLDMHSDFNFHPNNLSWFRNINILIYLNRDWKKEYGGELKLRDGRLEEGDTTLIEPIFNRAVIMFTRGHTVHGYDPISFPKGTYRRSIAAYGYTQKNEEGRLRTTLWVPEKGSAFKRVLGRHMHKLVKIKSLIFGSGTTKNK